MPESALMSDAEQQEQVIVAKDLRGSRIASSSALAYTLFLI
jgi:hypothetical protein